MVPAKRRSHEPSECSLHHLVAELGGGGGQGTAANGQPRNAAGISSRPATALRAVRGMPAGNGGGRVGGEGHIGDGDRVHSGILCEDRKHRSGLPAATQTGGKGSSMAGKGREQGEGEQEQAGMEVAATGGNSSSSGGGNGDGDGDLLADGTEARLATALAEAAGQVRAALQRPLPIPAGLLLKAENSGLPDFPQAVRTRFVAAVLERMGKVLTERGKELRGAVDTQLMAMLSVMGEAAVALDGIGRMSMKEWRGASFDKSAMARALLDLGVDVAVIESAMAAGNKEHSKDVLEMRWKKGGDD